MIIFIAIIVLFIVVFFVLGLVIYFFCSVKSLVSERAEIFTWNVMILHITFWQV